MDFGTTVNEAGRDRAERADAAMKAAGVINFQEATAFAFGTELMSDGRDTFRQKKIEQVARPLPPAFLAELECEYAAEARRDVEVELHDLGMNERGNICRVQDNGKIGGCLPVSRWAFGQMMARAGAPGGAGGYLLGCPVEGENGRRRHANQWLAQSGTWAKSRGKDSFERVAQKVVLRTRKQRLANANGATHGKPGIYACVSPGYARFDFPDAAKAFLSALPSHARCEFLYDGQTWKIRASYADPSILPENVVVGDTWLLAPWISGADDGSASFTFGIDGERIRCINCTTIWSTTVEGSLKHVGQNIATKIAALAGSVASKVAPFVEAWQRASVTEVIDNNLFTPEVVFNYLVENGHVHATGTDDAATVQNLLMAFHAEPGQSQAHILNAITRAGHEGAWASPWAETELAEQAGQLAYNFVQIVSGDAATGNGEVDRFSKIGA